MNKIFATLLLIGVGIFSFRYRDNIDIYIRKNGIYNRYKKLEIFTQTHGTGKLFIFLSLVMIVFTVVYTIMSLISIFYYFQLSLILKLFAILIFIASIWRITAAQLLKKTLLIKHHPYLQENISKFIISFVFLAIAAVVYFFSM